MLEFIKLPHGMVFPHACVACTGTAGPMIDTHRELHPYGRVYLCAACTKRLAAVMGLIAGEEADATAAALERLSVVERDLAESERRREQMGRELDVRANRIDELEGRVVQQDGRINQLVGRLAENAKADLELVTRD